MMLKRLYSIFFASIIIVSLQGQDTAIYNQDIVLNSNLSSYNTVDIAAANIVTLTDGFTFSSDGNRTLSAKAGVYDVNLPVGFAPYYDTSQFVSDLNLELPVGSVPGQAGVSSSGAATYSIAIQVPKGTNGMEPRLGVSYSSHAGSGIMGKGWNLNGLSSIRTTGRNYYYDSIKGPLSANDSLCRLIWNGSRLYGTNGIGLTASNFVTEIYSNTQITKLGSGQSASFMVKLPNGITLEYGTSSNSRMHLSSSIEWLWLLEKSYDRYGNTIKYNYASDTLKKQVLLSSIEYGGPSTSPVNEINFHYSTMTDLNFSNILGHLVVNDQRLDSISIHTNQVFISGYSFKYDTASGESLLSRVYQYDKDGYYYNPTMIVWEVPDINIDPVETLMFTKRNADNYFAGDFNGDGYTDLLSIRDSITTNSNFLNCYVYHGSSNSKSYGLSGFPNDTFHIPKSYTSYFWNEIRNLRNYSVCDPLYPLDSVDFYVNQTDLLGVFIGDYDADGKDELFVKYSEWDKLSEFLPSSLTNENVLNAIENSGFAYTICDLDTFFYSTHLMNFDSTHYVRIVNLDNLPLEDPYIAFEASKLFPTDEQYSEYPDISGRGYKTFHGDSSLYHYNLETNSIKRYCELRESPRWGEFNGDGMPDYIHEMTDSFSINTFDVETKSFLNRKTIIGTLLGQIDLNQDGSQGYVYISDPSLDTIKLMIGFLEGPEQDVLLEESAYGIYFDRAFSWDIDSDGDDDLMLFGEYAKRVFYNFSPALINNEIFFSFDQSDIYTQYYYNRLSEIGDFNGDGSLEMVGFSKIANAGIMSFNTNNIPQKRVSNITNGLGGNVRFYYKPLTNPEVYTKDTYDSFPVTDYIAPVDVVSEIALDNGIADPDSIKYNYQFAKYHQQGKGMLGFERIVKENLNTQTKVINDYSYSRSYFVTYPISSSLAIKNNTVKSGNLTYTISRDSLYRIKILADEIEATDHLNNVTTTTTISYNNYAQPIEKKTLIGTEFVSEKYTYTNAGWTYPLLPKTVTKTFSRDSVITDSTIFSYNALGGINTQKKLAGTDREIITRYSNYNSYGSPGKVTTIAKSGVTLEPDSVTVDFTFSSCGRFVLSKKGSLNTNSYIDYDLNTGLVQKSTSVNDLSVNYEYGPFYSLEKEISPDGIIASTKTYWALGHSDAPEGALYYSWSAASGSQPVQSFYDQSGRILRSVSTGFNGELLYSDIKYDNRGRVSRKSLPYFKNNTPIWDSIQYDTTYGRVLQQIAHDGTTTEFEYDALWLKTTVSKGSLSQSSEISQNAWGETIQSKDNIGNIVYSTYLSDGKLKESYTSVHPGQKTTFQYDAMGNRIKISDPDAGIITSFYDGFGRLNWQVNAKGDTSSYIYDKLGRTVSMTDDRGDIQYVYIADTTSAAFGQVDSIYNTDGSLSVSYNYSEDYGRLLSTTSRSPGKTFTNSLSYDYYGRVKTRTYPSGFDIQYSYTENGDLAQITGNGSSIWTCNNVSELGQITSYSQGNYNTMVDFDAFGVLEEVETGSVFNMKYSFDDLGNLEWRSDERTLQKEVFSYDNLNRLTGVDYFLNSNPVSLGDLDISYDNGGNITYKSDVGDDINYGDNGAGPHAITSIEDPLESYVPPPQNITYTSFNKVRRIQDTISQDTTLTLDFSYGMGNQRIKMVSSKNSTIERVKYYHGDYEEDSTATGIKKYHYINAPNSLTAIFVSEGSADTLYYVLTDHLGSLTGVINEETDSVTYYSYNAWGIPRDPEVWTAPFAGELFAGRGYTGHEHLSEFTLINMNGRVYDPVLARFLSPDPFVQVPGYANNHNRYSYVLNNPLNFTDPSGYELATIDYVPDSRFSWSNRYAPGNMVPDMSGSFGFGFSTSGGAPGDYWEGLARRGPSVMEIASRVWNRATVSETNRASWSRTGGYSYWVTRRQLSIRKGRARLTSGLHGKRWWNPSIELPRFSFVNNTFWRDGLPDNLATNPIEPIDLSDPSFPGILFSILNDPDTRGSIREIVDINSISRSKDSKRQGWGNLESSTKYEFDLKYGGMVRIFDFKGENYYTGLTQINVANSHRYAPFEIPLSEYPKIKGKPGRTPFDEYPYSIDFYFQVFNEAGTYSENLIGVSFRFTNYNLFAYFYKLFSK